MIKGLNFGQVTHIDTANKFFFTLDSEVEQLTEIYDNLHKDYAKDLKKCYIVFLI
jgi:hypothetical protein